MRRHALRSVVVACAFGTLLAALPTTPAVAVDDRPPIVWRDCGRGFECGSLTVPLEYATPDGPMLELAVVRAPARGRGQRIGSLVVNPGGPGAPGVAYVKGVADSLPAELRDRFDIVGFDPRGVGASGSVSCAADIDPLFDEDFAPMTDDARARLVDAFATVVDACKRSSGGLLPHVATLDTARDLDTLRAALGDRTLSFVGQSYGTYLGTVYASLFADRVRALVFDGAIDPGADGAAVALGQARGFEQALGDFLADCARRRACPFHHDGRTGAAYDALRARADREPIPARSSGSRALNRTRFDAAVLESLYSGRAGWSALADALAAAEGDDASALLARADAFVTRGANGHEHGALDAFWAISCLDGPIVGDVDAAARLQARAEAVAPRVGAFLVNFSLACSMWPVAPVTVPTALTASGAPTILVVGTTRDPATPLESAKLLTRSLDKARLLVASGEQHASFAIGNGCVDRAITRYLVDRALPARGTRC